MLLHVYLFHAHGGLLEKYNNARDKEVVGFFVGNCLHKKPKTQVSLCNLLRPDQNPKRAWVPLSSALYSMCSHMYHFGCGQQNRYLDLSLQKYAIINLLIWSAPQCLSPTFTMTPIKSYCEFHIFLLKLFINILSLLLLFGHTLLNSQLPLAPQLGIGHGCLHAHIFTDAVKVTTVVVSSCVQWFWCIPRTVLHCFPSNLWLLLAFCILFGNISRIFGRHAPIMTEYSQANKTSILNRNESLH